jgi:hypothetical protein
MKRRHVLFTFLGLALFLAFAVAATHWTRLKAQDINQSTSSYSAGCQAVNAEIPPDVNGTSVWYVCDLVGKTIVMPYANKENFVSGAASQTSTTQTQIIAAGAAGVKLYITSLQCFNTGAVTSTITLTDSSSWVGVNPAGGGFIAAFPTPLFTATATALKFTPGSASATQYCNAQGYSGS